ncbi:PD-(D/E)XK nuclease family protein, partial [Campylobacter sp.]|uniref:PD-(D/E)XK nuclease family protein n=1 Tax=Campylobacter sp. TaxID=205 RepID=UPI00270D7108|nr:PD-(D/E)XK nuclease family protein [Campylobacter sp.]
ANKFVIAIENKIYADESNNQLKKYRGILEKNYPEFEKICIFLTLNERISYHEEEQNLWLTASHKMIGEIIESLLEKRNLHPKTELIFSSYVDLLKRKNIMEDKELKKIM